MCCLGIGDCFQPPSNRRFDSFAVVVHTSIITMSLSTLEQHPEETFMEQFYESSIGNPCQSMLPACQATLDHQLDFLTVRRRFFVRCDCPRHSPQSNHHSNAANPWSFGPSFNTPATRRRWKPPLSPAPTACRPVASTAGPVGHRTVMRNAVADPSSFFKSIGHRSSSRMSNCGTTRIGPSVVVQVVLREVRG